MKNFKKFTAFVLALCMLFSLSVAVFAAEADEHTIYDSAPDEETVVSNEAATSGTIQNSGIRWSLDEKGWLTISGSGEAPVFTSADDQPWAAARDQITEVWFEDVETLSIPDLAYWFEGCVNLTTAELPLAPVIGRHAFYGCSKLSTLTMYYGETVLKSIGEDAFWREADSGDTLYIAYIIGFPEATVPFYTYDWTASNRSERYFYDLYGVYQNADAGSAATSGIKKAPGISVQSTGSIIGNCPSCGKYSFQGTYVEVAHSSRGHANYNECYACHYVQYLGTYTYKSHGAGGYGSGTCPDCGSHTWVLQSQQAATCTSNGYRSYSCACGQTKSETIYASGHNYSYGSWEQYSSSQHRREAYCRNCGDSDYEYASHSMSYGSWSNHSDMQHSRTATCRTCGYSTTDYGNHSYTTGSWSKYSDTQHRRSKTCSGCGASTYDYADHSYSYGSWVSDSETQHKRTKTCSACGDSGYEYADHTDANGDGKCDNCGATVSLTVTWDAGSNGGTIDGKASITTTGKPNATATAPTSTPVKTGHAFKGWYTSASGGSLYNTVTITAAKTFYAQFTANSYTLTWDLGNGTTEETKQTYHDADTHPHIHMMIWTDQETVLKRDAVVKLRSAMTNSIFQAELENLYIRKDAAYKDVTEAARAVMHELVDCMEAVSDPPASIQQKLLELAMELRMVGGKKQYAYLKKPLKDKVDSIVDELEKLPEVAAYYDVWNGLRDTLEGYYKNRPRQRNPLSQQKEFRAIKNAIIQEAERLRQQMELEQATSEQKPSQEEDPSSEEPSTGASANPTPASESALSATSHSVQLPSEYLLNSTARLFHQMGQIFRDNAAPPSNPMGIRIDSKRRKKLMQKRLAMGHKQDDHEQERGYNLDIR